MKIKRYIPKKPFIIAGSGLALSGILFSTAVTFYHHAQPPKNDTIYRNVAPAEQQSTQK